MTNPSSGIVVTHADGAEWNEGLRAFFAYRDLGMAGVTSGRFQAHVIRANGERLEGGGVHRHDLDFQMVYVLKGWVRFWYDGFGEVTLTAGSCVHQPPGILHEERGHSADLEMLEITSPAEFRTEAV